jgi:ABC-type multidrug transport system ATPase subunit
VDPEDLSQKSEDYDDHNTKTILRNINGFAMPGELLAIMGPSGCGKTSLLNIIADRQLPGQKNHEIIRDVKANNIIIDQSNFGKICAYIMQEDILMDCLSPRESLIFGARLRLKSSNEEILNRVERLLKQVKFLFNK